MRRALCVCLGLMTAIPLALGTGSCGNALPRCAPPPPPPEPPKPPPVRNVEHVLVDFSFEERLDAKSPADVASTAEYKEGQRENGFTGVALRVPERCLTETAGEQEGTGGSGNQRVIMETACGVWLAELERALVEAGFRVISWAMFAKALKSKEAAEKSAYVAARELGADVMFVVNSLETADSKVGGDNRAVFEYFTSDKQGSKGQPALLKEQDRAFLRKFVSVRVRIDRPIDALASTLDATAIDTKTGQSLWFYRRTLTRDLETNAAMRFLFRLWDPATGEEPRLKNNPPYIWPVAPAVAATNGPVRRIIPDERSARDEISGSVEYRTEQRRAKEREMVQEIACDFARRFRTGSDDDFTMAPMTPDGPRKCRRVPRSTQGDR